MCSGTSAPRSCFGWPSHEALGQQADTLLHTRFPHPPAAIEAEVLRTGHWEGELVHTRRDGALVTVSSRWVAWHQDHGAPPAIVEISTDITEHRRVERSQRLLAEVGSALTTSLDATSRLADLAQVVVPLLADWCIVHVAEDGETMRPVAAAHADPWKSAEANDLLRRDLPDPYVPPGATQVLHTGLSAFYREPSTASYAALARDADQIERVRSLGVNSAMIVPLVARGRALGVVTLVVSAESDRVYTAPDL